jgi:hypothetical protein
MAAEEVWFAILSPHAKVNVGCILRGKLVVWASSDGAGLYLF